ncbi:MBOAT family protein [Candidatus Woesearchaeota archaeon]|nr:MBOAT family protein [Candidatus Woesearchaeota archaeon]HIH37559.1 MBOAT family protein [Candidatus Woesearchaeota archaeon]HIH47972.1 MBOAT family protein [Candidatus Woesearchaeota archaeon]HIJ03700.1 MBOAT family protein [Candidatus Woesearchaeota archaeon]
MIYLFHSTDFIIFFVGIFCLYWLSSHRYRNVILLIASYLFYISWDWRFLGLLLISTGIDYYCGIRLGQEENVKKRRGYLLLSIVVNLSLLGFFKYFNFFTENLIALLSHLGLAFNYTTLHIILPVGISFYTFQTLSYTFDVYKRRMGPTRNIIDFALFVSFFPQLIAGPIERAVDLIPKLTAKKQFKNIPYKTAFYLFMYGAFTKVVIADHVGLIADSVFKEASPPGSLVVLGVLAFALQIYCDFSGYSNMARGIAYFLGVELSVNFNLPYFSIKPSEFWKRWHITLSSWVQDYLYIPLGGNKARFYSSLIISMFLMGLWHGAGWNFILWGVYWAGVTIVYRVWDIFKEGKKLPSNSATKSASILIFFIITSYSWLIFRSQSFHQIISLTTSLLSGIDLSTLYVPRYLYLYASMIFILIYEVILYQKNDQLVVPKQGFYTQMAFYLILFFLFVEIGAVTDATFIYFQF